MDQDLATPESRSVYFQSQFASLKKRYDISEDDEVESFESLVTSWLLEEHDSSLYLHATLPNFTPLFSTLLSSLFHSSDKPLAIEFEKEFNKLVQEIKTLKEDNEELRKLVVSLREENQKLNDKNLTLEEQIRKLVLKSEVEQCFLYAHDLFYLFSFYFVEPIARTNGYINMKTFWDTYANYTAQYEDSEITKKEYEAFLAPFSKLPVTLEFIRKTTHQRVSIAHTDVRSVVKQQDSIKKMETQTFPSELAPVVAAAIKNLTSTKLRRMN